MKSKKWIVARYWFLISLLIAVVGLQAGAGLIALSDEHVADVERDQAKTSSLVRITFPSPQPLPAARFAPPTHLPTFTSTPAPTPTPAFTATPTLTFTPTKTPTSRFTFASKASREQNRVDKPTQTNTPLPTDTPLPLPTLTNTPPPTPQPPAPSPQPLDLPILMYHYLSAPPPGANAVRRDLSVAPDLFETHLAYLRYAGYETISLGQLADAFGGQTTLPPKPIILTFDDGYRDNYENAFPILKKYSYKATFFIFTQPIDTYNVDYLSWDMVKEMHQAGMEFGSHSYRHYDLSGKGVDLLVYEILGSKQAIEERIGEPVLFFCYPAGRYDNLTIQVLESAHYWGAVTTQWGVKQAYDHRFELQRIRVRGSDTAEDLATKLAKF